MNSLALSRRAGLAMVVAWLALPARGSDRVGASVAERRRRQLQHFMSQAKFGAHGPVYTGIQDATQRRKASAVMNELAGSLLAWVDSSDPKPGLLQAFEAAWPRLALRDSEDRERAAEYLEDLMAVFEIRSADGLLNRLVYGFDAQRALDERQALAEAAMTSDEAAFALRLRQSAADQVVPLVIERLGAPTDRRPDASLWLLDAASEDFLALQRSPEGLSLVWRFRSQVWRWTWAATSTTLGQ